MWLLILTANVLITLYEALTVTNALTALIRILALDAFMLLCVSLIIGPLITMNPTKYGTLMESRRAVGIAAFLFMLGHFTLVFSQYFGFNLESIISNPALVIVIPALIIFFIMALTSNDYSMKKLGMNWKRIHQFTYLGFVLVLTHFLLKSNGLLKALEGKAGWNVVEIAVFILAVITIALQVKGFWIRKKS